MMDGRRFDTMTRALAGRASRRGAVGAAGALAIGAVLPAARAKAQSETPTASPEVTVAYTVVRRHRVTGDAEAARSLLASGYAALLARRPGFEAFSVFRAGDDLVSVSRFADRASEGAATEALATWVAERLAPTVTWPDETLEGESLVEVAAPAVCPATVPADLSLPACTDPGEPGRGCPCHSAVPDPCGVGTLLCCPTEPSTAGGPGVCVPDRLGCNPTGG